MSTIEEVQQTVTDLTAGLTATNAALDAIDAKLDEVRTFIATLSAGAVTQAQLDSLATMLTSAKDATTTAQAHAEAVLVEADALDTP